MNMPMKRRREAPKHLVIVGVAFFLVYLFGAYDYWQIQTGNQDYIQSLRIVGDASEYFSNYPKVFTAFWTVHLVAGLAASVLLLLRVKLATGTALVAASAKLVLDGLTFILRDRWSVFGPEASLVDLSVLLVSFLFVLYCRAMVRQSVLES